MLSLAHSTTLRKSRTPINIYSIISVSLIPLFIPPIRILTICLAIHQRFRNLAPYLPTALSSIGSRPSSILYKNKTASTSATEMTTLINPHLSHPLPKVPIGSWSRNGVRSPKLLPMAISPIISQTAQPLIQQRQLRLIIGLLNSITVWKRSSLVTG